MERRTVVVVDDEEDVRSLVVVVLLSAGVDVVAEGASGWDAIDLVAAHRPDVLVLDHGMPHLAGAEAIPRLREASPDTRIVLFTATDPSALAAAIGASPPDALVRKGSPNDELIAAVLGS